MYGSECISLLITQILKNLANDRIVVLLPQWFVSIVDVTSKEELFRCKKEIELVR